MADELDPRLEGRLREALRAEAGALPLAIRASELRRAAVERASARRARRMGLLAAAAAITILIGGAAVLAVLRPTGEVATPSGLTTPVPATVAPTTTPAPALTPVPSPAALASYGELEQALAETSPDEPILLRAEQPFARPGAATEVVDIGPVPAHEFLDFALDCTGGTVAVRVVDGVTVLFAVEADCPSVPSRFTDRLVSDGPARIEVEATGGAAWRIVVAGWLRDAPPASPAGSAPPEAGIWDGETRLVAVEVTDAEGPVERIVTRPRYVPTTPSTSRRRVPSPTHGAWTTYQSVPRGRRPRRPPR